MQRPETDILCGLAIPASSDLSGIPAFLPHRMFQVPVPALFQNIFRPIALVRQFQGSCISALRTNTESVHSHGFKFLKLPYLFVPNIPDAGKHGNSLPFDEIIPHSQRIRLQLFIATFLLINAADVSGRSAVLPR